MPTPSNSLLNNLRDEHKAMAQLVELIKQERVQLLEANIDKLNELTQEKSRLVAHMSELANRRDNALAAAGFTSKETAMKSWLSTAGSDAGAAWSALLSLTESAKELNRVNGMLINRHMSDNQNALNALHAAPQGSNVYGPNGQSTVKPVTRRLVVG